MRALVATLCLGFLCAVWLPGQQKETMTVEALLFDLKHPDAERRRQAALLAGRNQLRQAVPGLIALTEDEEVPVRRQAVWALVEVNDPRALDAYSRLTADAEADVQKKAIEGIVKVYVEEEGGFIEGVKRVVRYVNPFTDDYNPLMVEPWVPVSEQATAAIAAQLSCPDSGVRKDAATALGILRAASALPAIQDRIGRESSSSIQVELIRAVYKIGDPAAARSLIPLIRDPDKRVHDEAILALGRLRVTEAVPPLRELYEAGIEERRKVLGFVPVTGSDDMQRKLLQSLAYIGDPGCSDLFLNALADGRGFYRRYGAEGLGRAEARDATTELARRYLREDSGSVKLALSFALYRVGREEHLIELVDQVTNEQAYHYLLEMTPDEVEKLYPYLQSESESTQAYLLEIVGLRGGMSAIPVVEGMLASPEPGVAAAANEALRRLRASG